MTDERTLRVLRSLAESDREHEAPPDVEARLRRDFREHRMKRARRHRTVWVGTAALAAGLVIAAMLVPRRIPETAPKPSPTRTPVSASVTNERPLQAAQPARRPTSHRAAKLARAIVAPAFPASPVNAVGVPQAETVTDFFPLLDPAPPFERGEILRVNLPASVMRTVGLPVREERMGDRVQADILVGEEGLPRAIRFVSIGNFR